MLEALSKGNAKDTLQNDKNNATMISHSSKSAKGSPKEELEMALAAGACCKIAHKTLPYVKCILNEAIFSSQNKKYDYYSCMKCDMNFICTACFMNCHKGHNKEIKKAGEAFIAVNPCHCGRKYHQTEPEKIKEDIDEYARMNSKNVDRISLCSFDEELLLFLRSNSKKKFFLYANKSNNNDFLCKFCYDNCCDQKDAYEMVTQSNIDNLKGPFICNCQMNVHDNLEMFKSMCEFIEENFSISGKYEMIINQYLKSGDEIEERPNLLNDPNNDIDEYANILSSGSVFHAVTQLNLGQKALTLDKTINANEINEQFRFFIKTLKQLLIVGCNLERNERILSTFSSGTIDNLIETENNEAIVFDIQLFYFKVHRLIFLKPQFYSFVNDPNTSNISALHRIMFGNSVLEIKTDDYLDSFIKHFNDKIKQLLASKTSDVIQEKISRLIIEYLKYIKILLLLSAKDFNKIKSYTNYILEVMNRIEGLVNSNAINAKIQKLCELIFVMINDIKIYQEAFNIDNTEEVNDNQSEHNKSKDDALSQQKTNKSNRKQSEENQNETEEELNFAYANTEFNNLILSIIFNKTKTSREETEESRYLIDNLINPNDYYISALKEINSYEDLKYILNKALLTLITKTDYQVYLNKGSLLRCFADLHCSIEEIDKDLTNLIQTSKEINFDAMNKMLDDIQRRITACTDDSTNLKYFQTAFVAVKLFPRLIRYISLCNYVQNASKNNKSILNENEQIKKTRQIVCNLVLAVIQKNQFISSLLFNNKFYKLFLNELNEGNLNFYLTIIKSTFYGTKYKLNVLSLVRHLTELEKKTEIDIKLYTKLLQFYKKLICIADDKSYASINQLIAIDVIEFTSKQFEMNALIQTYLDDQSKEDNKDTAYMLAFFSLWNKLENNIFQITKEVVNVEILAQCLSKESIKQYENFILMKNLKIRKHFVHFYNKSIFASLYQWNTDDFFDLSLRHIVMSMFDPLIDTMVNFPLFAMNTPFTNEDNIISMLSFLKNAIAIPTFLIIWKIVYYYSLTIQEKYIIYKIIFLFLECVNKTLEQMEGCDLLQNQSERLTKALENTFGNDFSLGKGIDTISIALEKIKKKDFECLNLDKCFTLYLDAIGMFRFFNEDIKHIEQVVDTNKENKSDKHSEHGDNEEEDKKSQSSKSSNKNSSNNSNSGGGNLINNVFGITEENEFAIYDKYIELIQQYEDGKEENILMNLFDEENTKTNTEVSDKIILELINSIKIHEKSLLNRLSIEDKVKVYDYTNYEIMIAITKLFKTNPRYWQETLLIYHSSFSRILIAILEYQNFVLAQIVLYDQANVLPSSDINLKILIQNIEFLRLLCEDHNPIFQTFLIRNEEFVKDDIVNSPKALLNLVFALSVEIIKIFSHNKKQKKYINLFISNDKFESLIELEETLNDLRIEVIQGTTENNLRFINDNKFFKMFFDLNMKFIQEIDMQTETNAQLGATFLQFLNCFIEENSVLSKPNLSITQKINTKQLLIDAERIFDYLLNRNGIYLKEEKDKVKKQQSVDKFNEVISDFYNYYEKFTNDPYFTIAFEIFVYLNKISDVNDKISNTYRQILADLSQEKSEESSKYDTTINYEYYKFCSPILMKNDVMYTVDFSEWKNQTEKYMPIFNAMNKDNNDMLGLQVFTKCIKDEIDSAPPQTNRITIHYLKQHDSFLITEEDSFYFKKQANYADYYTKLSGILNYYSELSDKVGMRKRYNNEPLMQFLSELKMDKLEIYNVIACLIPNFLLIFASPGDIYSSIIFYWEICLLIVLLLIIANYTYFNFIKVRYIIDKPDKTFRDYLTPLTKGEITPFLLSFIFGLLGLKYTFCYCFQLLPIFNVSETMGSVLFSIKVRYLQFLAATFLLFILILFYAACTLYFFNINDDGSYLCTSYFQCFLYLFNDGLRAGGVPFEPKIGSQPGFWSEFIYSWIFYFLIILIILNIINGIIVDTFQDLKEKNSKIAEEKQNICFICQLSRSQFESKGLDFNYHLSKEHNVYYYFCYLFKVKGEDVHDLNSVDFQVFNSISENKVEFFPIDRATGVTDDR